MCVCACVKVKCMDMNRYTKIVSMCWIVNKQPYIFSVINNIKCKKRNSVPKIVEIKPKELFTLHVSKECYMQSMPRSACPLQHFLRRNKNDISRYFLCKFTSMLVAVKRNWYTIYLTIFENINFRKWFYSV